MKINRKILSFLITTMLFLSTTVFVIAIAGYFKDFTGEGHDASNGGCHGFITESASGYISISSSSGSSVNPSETFTITIQISSFSEAQGKNVEVGFPRGTPGRGDNKDFSFNTTQETISIDGSGNSATLDFQVTAPATEQTYTLHSDAIKKVGGSSYFVQGDFIVTVEIPNNPPQFSNIVESSNPLEFGQQETFQVDVTDSETSVDTVFIELEGTNYTMSNIVGDTFEYNWTSSTIGIKNYVFYANDTVGSWNSTSGSINVIDSTLPNLTNLLESADPLELGQTETIQINATDLSGISQVLIEIESKNYTMANIGGTIWEYDSWTPSTTGLKLYTIFTNDTEGNWNTLDDSITVQDTVQPSLTSLVESADPLELGQTETIQINATDLSGISQVLIEISSANYSMNQIDTNTYQFNSWIPSSVGVKGYTIYANDTKGNWNSLSNSITVQDTIQPSLTSLVESADPLELGQTETIQINASDLSGISHVLIEIGGINYTMTKISSATWEYNSWTPISAGIKPYTIYANDTEGNWNSINDDITVVDTIAPTYSDLIESADPLPLGQNETITIKVYDTPGSGVKEVILEYDSSNHTMIFMGVNTWTWSNWKPSSIGTFNYFIYMTDNSNNLNTTSGSIDVFISAGPTIQNLSKSADPLELGEQETIQVDVNDTDGISDVFIEIGGINYTMGNIGGIRYEYAWSPTSIGTKLFTIHANDSLNNWNQLSDSISVQDTTPPNYSNLVENSDPLELGNTLIISIDATDLSGINQLKFEIDGVNITMSYVGGNTWSNDTWLPVNVNIYSYTIYIQDNSNNWNSTSGSIEVIDTISPELSNLYEESDPLELGQSETIQINITDLAPISSVLIEIEGLNYTMSKISSNTWEYNSWTPSSTGLKIYTIYANDSSNNRVSLTSNISVIDTTGPALSNLFENADPLEFGQTEIIQIEVNDFSGISHVLIEISGVNYTMADIGGTKWEYSWIPSSLGLKLYTIYANDTINNRVSLDGNITVTDTSGPTLFNIVKSSDSIFLGQSVSIQVNVTDLSGISDVLIELENSNHTMTHVNGNTWEINNLTPNTIGSLSFTIYANDSLGNWNSESDTIVVNIQGGNGNNGGEDFDLIVIISTVVIIGIIVSVLVIILKPKRFIKH